MKNNIYPILSFEPNEYVLGTAKILIEIIKGLLQKKDKITIALSGGNSPLPIYKRLSQFQLNWKNIEFFFVDERCVSSNNIQNNYRNINNYFLKSIPSRSFPIVTKKGNFKEQAIRYEKLLKSRLPIVNGIPQFDLILLGMGLDGHTASLFPNTKALNNTQDLVVLNQVPQLKTERITMTYPLIMNAHMIILLAGGKEKKAVLDKLNANKHPITKLIPNIFKIIN